LTDIITQDTINLPADDPAIVKLLIDCIYIGEFDTDTVLEGQLNNRILLSVEVYALAVKYGVEIARDCVLDGLQLTMVDLILKLNVPAAQRTPITMARAFRAMTHLTDGLRFVRRHPEGVDADLADAITLAVEENRHHLPSEDMFVALENLPRDLHDLFN
jgi:hypothetical protein